MAAQKNIDTRQLFMIDHSDGLPVWIQIKNRVVYLIASGSLNPGDRLPTVRSLAVELDISYNTVNRAYMDLERDGFVTTRKGRGTFVAERPSNASTQKMDATEILADEMIHTALQAGMTKQDVLKLVEERFERSKTR